MIRVLTAYSVYEIDEDNKRVRRTTGLNEPTPRQGPDGEWKQCQDIVLTTENTFLFVWGVNDDGTLRCTETSHIVDSSPVEIPSHAEVPSHAT